MKKMENFCARLLFIIFSATAAVVFTLSDYSCCAHQSKENNGLFVFGDSIFDPGNNNNINNTNGIRIRANYFPYGQTFFKNPTGRFSNGRLIPDFIAEFAQLPLIPAFLENGHQNEWAYGVNFASGGSGALAETRAGSVIDLKTQLRHFEKVEKELIWKLGKKEAEHLLSNSVYLFSVGGNDLMVATSSDFFSSYSPEEYVTILIGNFTQVIKELHKKGARKFGFMNVIPLGCLPFFRVQNQVNIGQCEEKITSLTKLYNAALAQRLEELQKQLNGFHYSYFDSFTAIMDMIDNPSKYGLKEAKSACCGSGAFRGTHSCGGMRGIEEYELCKDPEEYFFFDSVHPSEKGHRILAELMWHGALNITRPFNLKSFFQLTEEVIHSPTSTAAGIKIENLFSNDEL